MKSSAIFLLKYCRVCKEKNVEKVASFGPTPLANAFLKSSEVDLPECYYPLDLYFCNSCGFLQLGHVVNPSLLFKNYVYASSTSQVFIKHFQDFASKIVGEFSLNKDSLAVDIGSNDGILLKPFKNLGIKILGVDPAEEISKKANREGIPTLIEFFDSKIAKKIKKTYGSADIITATNAFAHIHDLDEIIKGLKILLKDQGVFIIEAPYIIDFLKNKYFDLVYHEHLSYWSVRSLITLFHRFDMKVFDVEKVGVHGGSLRVFVALNSSDYKIKKNVRSFLKQEKLARVDKKETYVIFGSTIQKSKLALIKLLAKIKSKNKIIAGYGAPAKGNTLLNFFGIGNETIDYIVDDSPLKQGLFSPGKKIPIVSPEYVRLHKPDYLFILAWNFADSIIERYGDFRKKGGKFIIPFPTPKIV
ncbi:MAG: class I SAM-dependent methyltransferase [Candidatus Levybacteria bacterium]|nr:class I SAM-dependent methyltransferase [Candidatus Levybacteria bacterium]